MVSHSSSLVWRIPWTEKPGRLWTIGSRRVNTIEWLPFPWENEPTVALFIGLKFYWTRVSIWLVQFLFCNKKENNIFNVFKITSKFSYLLCPFKHFYTILWIPSERGSLCSPRQIMYNQPSKFTDSTKHRWKIFKEKNSRNFQKAKLQYAVHW